jgi:quercetin dioxygenase-like cupin family protein
MQLNDDFTVRVAMHAAKMEWIPSPAKGVDRRMLFRIGDEKARATSIVRYAPQSRFPRHVHGGGEEILVLEGAFQDEYGDYPAGSYLRNPPGTAHAPGSNSGCLLFVKLWQFRRDDNDRIVRRPGEGRQAEEDADGASTTALYDNPREHVGIKRWPPNRVVEIRNPDGLELLVLVGSFSEGEELFERQSWLRLPPGADLYAQAGPAGAVSWYKAAPLLQDNICTF